MSADSTTWSVCTICSFLWEHIVQSLNITITLNSSIVALKKNNTQDTQRQKTDKEHLKQRITVSFFFIAAVLGSFTQEAQHMVMEILGTGTTEVGDVERY